MATERGGFVWLGLYEPTRGRARRDRRAVRPAPARRRGRRLRPPAAQARAVRRRASSWCSRPRPTWSTSSSPRPARSSTPARSWSSSAPHYVITVRHGQHGGLADLRQPARGAARPALPGPRRGPLRRRRPRRRHLRRGRRRRWTRTSTSSRRRCSARERTDDIGRLYQLKRELMSLRRAVSPLEVPLQKLAERRDRRRPGRDALLLPRRRWTTRSGCATRWPRSTSCSPRSCRPRWRAPRWPTTRTCARSRPGPRSSPSRR